MFEIDLDFEDIEAAVPFEPVKAGKYTLIIEAAKINEAKEPTEKNPDPAPQMELSFLIEDTDNKKIRHWVGLSLNARPYMLQFLQAIYDQTSYPTRISLSTEDECLEFCASLIGMSCEADVDKVKRNDNPNKYQNKIASFFPRL